MVDLPDTMVHGPARLLCRPSRMARLGLRPWRCRGILGVCATDPVVILANDDSNPGVVVVVRMAIVSIDGWGET